jgi:CheY-like chemotaxis protein
MAPFVDLLKAIASLAWPLLTALFLWRLMPAIKKVVESRGFTLKFAGIEVTAQEATDQIKSQLQDLKDQVIELRKISGKSVEAISIPAIEQLPNTILWVDDKPTNNALEISQLEGRGYKVLTTLSTGEAMATLAKEKVGFIISDMGRREEGHYIAQAGLVLLKAARQAGYKQPFVVYSSVKYRDKNDAEVKASGGVGATASPTTLLEWIETYLSDTGRTNLQKP